MWREPQIWPAPSDLPSCITLTESRNPVVLNGISHESATIRIPKTVKHIFLPFLYSSFEFEKGDADDRSSDGLELQLIVNKVHNNMRGSGGSIVSFRKDMGIWYELRQSLSGSRDGGASREFDELVIGTYGNAADYSMTVDPREFCHVEFRVVVPCFGGVPMDKHQIETISRRRKVLTLGDIPTLEEGKGGEGGEGGGGVRWCMCSDDDAKTFALPESARKENVSWGPGQLSYQRVPFVDERALQQLFPEIENAGVETEGGGGALAYLFVFLEMEEIVESILRVSKTFAKAGLFCMYFHKQFSAAEYCRMYDLSKGGIGESLLLRIAKWNKSFDFDYVVEMREDPHPIRSEEDYRPWWESRSQSSWEEERQFNVLWYFAHLKFASPELRDILFERSNSSALESRHVCEYFRMRHKEEIDSETVQRMLTCSGVDLTDLGRLRSLLYCASCQEMNTAWEIFLRAPEVREALRSANIGPFVRSLAFFDNIDGVRLLVEAAGSRKAAEGISQDLLSGLLHAPRILKYLIDEFGICPSPGFLQAVLKGVYQAGELTEKLNSVVRICLDDATVGENSIVPSEFIPMVVAIGNSDLTDIFRAHPGVLPRHFKLAQIQEDDVDLVKRLLGISEEDGEFFLDAPLDEDFANGLIESVCLKGFAQVGSMLLKVTDAKGSPNRVFVPTEDDLMKAIDPGVGPHTQFSRNNSLIVVLVKEGGLSLGMEHFDALTRLYNLQFLEEVYPDGGFEDLSEEQFIVVVGEVADQGYETGFVQKLLETRGLAVLPKMSPEIRNGLLLKVCKSMSELLPLLLKSENFFDGFTEVEPAVLKNLVSSCRDCDLIEFFLSATKMSAAQVTESEAIPEVSGNYDGDKTVKLLLSYHPDVDPSYPNNEALRQALWRQNYPTVHRLLQDPRVQEILEAQMCIESLKLSPHSDEKWVEITKALLSIQTFDPSSSGFAALISSLELDLNRVDYACRLCFLALFQHPKVQNALDASILPYLLQTTAAVPSGKFDLFFEVFSCFEDGRFSVHFEPAAEEQADLTYESVGSEILMNLVDKASVDEIRRVLSSDFVRKSDHVWKVSEDHVLRAKTRDRTDLVEMLLREIQRRTGQD